MPDYTATFTVHLTANIKARDHEAASDKAERLFSPLVKKLEAQLPPGIDLELNDYNPEINES